MGKGTSKLYITVDFRVGKFTILRGVKQYKYRISLEKGLLTRLLQSGVQWDVIGTVSDYRLVVEDQTEDIKED